MDRRILTLSAFAVLLITFMLVAGCTSAPVSSPDTPAPTKVPLPVALPSPPNAPIQPFAGTWVLTTMASRGGTFPSTPTTEITLTINASGTLQGYGGCNTYGGDFNIPGTTTPFGNSITIGPVFSTKKYCDTVSAQEDVYLNILRGTTAFAGDISHLTFTDFENNKLVYKRPGSVTPTATVPSGY